MITEPGSPDNWITAAEVDVTSRTITGMIVPWETPGHTSAGVVSIQANAIEIPKDITRVKLLSSHSVEHGIQPEPIGVPLRIWSEESGLWAEFKIANTRAGDEALTLASEGVKDALSIELRASRISGNKVIAGQLKAVAHVAMPAYETARITNVTASEDSNENLKATASVKISNSRPFSESAPKQDKEPETMTPEQIARLQELRSRVRTEAEETELIHLAALESQEAAAPEVETITETEKTETQEAPVAIAASAHAPMYLHASNQNEPTLIQAAEKIAGSYAVGSGELQAALAEVGATANPFVEPQGWLGEVWTAAEYTRKYVPLLTQRPLTNRRMTGWRWVAGSAPEVDTYAGDLAEIPTNEIETEEVTIELARIAGGHRFDRAFIDFNDAEYLASYWSRMATDYARKTDAAALAKIVEWADTANPVNTVNPANVLDAAAMGVHYLEDEFETQATFVLVSPATKRSLLSITAQDAPAFLRDILNIEPSAFVSSSSVEDGVVIVGAQPGGSFYEFGGSPIRLDAIALANGAFDRALFGYYGLLDNDARVFATIGLDVV